MLSLLCFQQTHHRSVVMEGPYGLLSVPLKPFHIRPELWVAGVGIDQAQSDFQDLEVRFFQKKLPTVVSPWYQKAHSAGTIGHNCP